MKTMKRFVASAMLSLALIFGTVQMAMADVTAVYKCSLTAILITAEGVTEFYDCQLVAIVITAD